ncbi:MAG: hypothetical protein N2712_01530 [Brevinematales bacterium]|nr:hypothetical protein [Brevinematales bacterium]
MKRLVVVVFSVSLVLFSCTPPKKEEIRYIYDYKEGFVYRYLLTIDGNGVLSYFLLSFSGRIVLTANVNVFVQKDARGKLFNMVIDNIAFKSSFGIDRDVNNMISRTNLVITFRMDEYGQKSTQDSNQLLETLLDIIIPLLPEVDTTNEISYKVFNFTLGDVDVRSEISNITILRPFTSKDFYVDSYVLINALELKNSDIVVAKIKITNNSRIENNIVVENNSLIDSKTTIPIYTGTATRVVGFKGELNLLLKLDKVM